MWTKVMYSVQCLELKPFTMSDPKQSVSQCSKASRLTEELSHNPMAGPGCCCYSRILELHDAGHYSSPLTR
jgi:hypothetical protein